VVERTFAWLGKYRRHSKDYEYAVETSETMIRATRIRLMARRTPKGDATIGRGGLTAAACRANMDIAYPATRLRIDSESPP
jgi:hypothetical protein